MFIIKSNFIGIFKIGDNINYNLCVLQQLYESREGAPYDKRKLFNKPITVILISIIEALLYDFHFRVKQHYVEGVKNLTVSVIDYIRGKSLDEFETLIASARKHQLFGNDNDFYNSLDDLRKLRNRIHIQNKKRHFEADESDAFTNVRLIKAERTLEKVMKVLYDQHSRGDHFNYAEDFTLPWEEHLR